MQDPTFNMSLDASLEVPETLIEKLMMCTTIALPDSDPVRSLGWKSAMGLSARFPSSAPKRVFGSVEKHAVGQTTISQDMGGKLRRRIEVIGH